MEVRIILPERADDVVSNGLRALSALIEIFGLGEEAHGVLGGPHGYGAEYNSDVFMMHPTCWCERNNCPWCASCTCPDEAFHYFVDGKEVSWDEWVDFFDREAGPSPSDQDTEAYEQWSKRADEVNKRRSRRHDAVCEFCTKGVGLEFGAEPGKPAPNFWHKPTNLKIWFYKWIGRDMEFNRKVSSEEWKKIFEECVADLQRAAASDEAKARRAAMEKERAEFRAWQKKHDDAGHLCHKCISGLVLVDDQVECMARGLDEPVVYEPGEWPASCDYFVEWPPEQEEEDL